MHLQLIQDTEIGKLASFNWSDNQSIFPGVIVGRLSAECYHARSFNAFVVFVVQSVKCALRKEIILEEGDHIRRELKLASNSRQLIVINFLCQCVAV